MRAGQPTATFSGSSSSEKMDWFGHLAMQTAILSGRPLTFLGAVTVVAFWAITGPIFHYSDTWQLVINTGTTIITFLMVLLNPGDAKPRHARSANQALRIDPGAGRSSQRACGGGTAARRRAQGRRGRHP